MLSKTSLPQTWHIPRGDKIHGKAVQEVQVLGYSKQSDNTDRQQPIKSTLYNPIQTSLPSVDDFFSSLRMTRPGCSLLTTVPPPGAAYPPTTPTKFGSFLKGSPLSYQQKMSSTFLLNIVDAHFSSLPLSSENVGDNSYCTALKESQMSLFESFSISQQEAGEFERSTRLQAGDNKWKRLRVHRITASKVGEISKKRDPEAYAVKLKTPARVVLTDAMRAGIVNEPVAANAYSKIKDDKINVYPSGIVINPKSPWMAASPDRKVLDPSSDPPFGFLKIKCPDLSAKDLCQLTYLKTVDGKLSLKTTDNYYHQIQMQLAMTGLKWCDFFFWSDKATHLERIFFDMEEWQKLRNITDKFFFDFFL